MSDQSSRRRQREQAETPAEVAPAQGKAAKPEPVTLEAMLGQGSTLTLGERTYEMSPLPLGRMKEAQDLLARWPQVLFFAGFTESQGDGSDLDAARVAEMLTAVNAGIGEEVGVVTADDVYRTVAYLSTTIDDDQVGAMADLIALALRRKHPDVSAAQITDEMDIPTALRALRIFFAVNGGLRSRFERP